MKRLLLEMYEKHNLKDEILRSWILKDSLVILANEKGNMITSFNVNRGKSGNDYHSQIKKLDITSLVIDGNKNIIRQADSNNRYCFMFKKENIISNPFLLKKYDEMLEKKVGEKAVPGLYVALKNTLDSPEFKELEKGWVKIFIDKNLEDYERERRKYIDIQGDIAIFTNTGNEKKRYLSFKSSSPSKNLVVSQGEELDKFIFLDKMMYMLIKENTPHIYFNNAQFLALSNDDARELQNFSGFYIKAAQDQGKGYIEEFTSICKKNEPSLEKLLRRIFIYYKKEDINFKGICDALNNFFYKGERINFKGIKSNFISLIEINFFKRNIDFNVIKRQFNIFYMLYEEEGEKMEDNTSYILGKVIKYLEGRSYAMRRYNDYRLYFKDSNFKMVQSNLINLIDYSFNRSLKSQSFDRLQDDVVKILDYDPNRKVDTIAFIKGYLAENSYN